MMCKHPFMRVIGGKIRWAVKMTEEEKLSATPFPCGKCLPCKINRARVWQHRILLELSTHDTGSFVTLTYNDDHLPSPPHLNPLHLTNFLKKFRRKIEPKRLRYFAVGEYGTESWRPHFHLALFGVGIEYYELIEKTWAKGFTMTGDLNKDSARYIAGYIIKKLTAKDDPRLEGRTPEFARSSRLGGGLGIEAIKIVAKKLKENEHYDNTTIREFLYGKKERRPLGRYLTEQLFKELGLSEEQKKKEFLDYQEQIFHDHISVTFNDYYFSIQQEMKNERHSQEKKHKIHNKRQKL